MDASALLASVRARRSSSVADAALALALYPASDLDNRRQLAAVAASALADPTVSSTWLACVRGETDVLQRDALVRRLLILRPQLSAEDQAAWVDVLLDSLGRETIRHGALSALAAYVAADPGLADCLVGAAQSATDAALRDHLDQLILDVPTPSQVVAAYWRSRLDGSGLSVRLRLAARLLDHGSLDDGDAARLLQPSEPAAVRELVLRAWLDRGLAPTPVVASTVRQDPDAGCRGLALDLLACGGGRDADALDAVLDTARLDADPRLRARAALILAGWRDPDGCHLPRIIEQLRAERDRTVFTATVTVVGPLLARVPALRLALVGLLESQLDAAAASALCTVLSAHVRSDVALREAMLDAYERLAHDRVRAAILAGLAGILAPDAALEPTFRRAMRSAAPELRTWGVRGFLRLDILACAADTAAAAAAILADLPQGRGYDARQLRRQLLVKLAVLRPLPVVIAHIANGDADDECRELAQRAVRTAADAVTADKPFDWDDALQRIQVRGDAAGLFPEVLERAYAEPAAARPVLHAVALALLTTGLEHAPCGLQGLLPHLVRCDALDATLVRAVAQRLRAEPKRQEDPSPDLAILRAHPELPEVLSAVEAVLPYTRRASPGLLRDLLTEAHGGDRQAAVAWLHQRLLGIGDPAVAEDLLPLLEKGEAWMRPDPVLLAWHAAFAAKPGCDRVLRNIATLCKRFGIPLPIADPAPSPVQRRPASGGGILDD